MKKVFVSLLTMGLMTGVAMAHCGACDGDAKTCTGVVSVTKDKEGGIAEVKVGNAKIVMDGNGEKVAAMAGKTVTVEGTMKSKAVVVTTVKPVEEKAPAQ